MATWFCQVDTFIPWLPRWDQEYRQTWIIIHKTSSYNVGRRTLNIRLPVRASHPCILNQDLQRHRSHNFKKQEKEERVTEWQITLNYEKALQKMSKLPNFNCERGWIGHCWEIINFIVSFLMSHFCKKLFTYVKMNVSFRRSILILRTKVSKNLICFMIAEIYRDS